MESGQKRRSGSLISDVLKAKRKARRPKATDAYAFL